ncbi:two-component system response regulator [Saccharobesus litoralis]|uniref:Two-component system response regulator n=2 Tax=Saccharobesus litoralis TaxID=2172099 RepID=A0A2S0VXL8_9ALTE|nr:two-component system response regulator [Saccharobesus litoralis]
MLNIDVDNLAVLLVEPSSMQRKLMVRELNKLGIKNIEEASNIEQGIDQCLEFKPDLVCSAYYFDDGTAIDLLQSFAVFDDMKESLFMLVSSEYRCAQLEIFRQSGVVAILPKPFAAAQLQSAFDNVFCLLNPQELELDGIYEEELKILLVDDSDTARNHIKRVFRNCGVEQIDEASDGQEAISLVEHNNYDLVVTDLHMPVMDGQELTDFIRNFSNKPDIPILMVTSEQNSAKLQAVQNSGINSLCDKPFEPTVVKQVIYSLLGHEHELEA